MIQPPTNARIWGAVTAPPHHASLPTIQRKIEATGPRRCAVFMVVSSGGNGHESDAGEAVKSDANEA